MAKAARLSGQEPDSEDYEEFEDMLEQDSQSANKVSCSYYQLNKMVLRVFTGSWVLSVEVHGGMVCSLNKVKSEMKGRFQG